MLTRARVPPHQSEVVAGVTSTGGPQWQWLVALTRSGSTSSLPQTAPPGVGWCPPGTGALLLGQGAPRLDTLRRGCPALLQRLLGSPTHAHQHPCPAPRGQAECLDLLHPCVLICEKENEHTVPVQA